MRESNARFVRWSDGSLQLLVGDEALDVNEIDTTCVGRWRGGALLWGYGAALGAGTVPPPLLARAAAASVAAAAAAAANLMLASPLCRGEHTYMFSRLHNLIQGQGQLAAKLVFQSASLQSNLHKQLRAAADKLHVKQQKVWGRGRWPGGHA